MIKIITIGGVNFFVSFCYPRGRKGSSRPCRALITPLDEQMKKITKRQLYDKSSDEPVNRPVYGQTPENIEQYHISAVADELIVQMRQKGLLQSDTAMEKTPGVDLAELAIQFKKDFFDYYARKRRWAESTCSMYWCQYDKMVGVLRGVELSRLTSDMEQALQETICRTASQTSSQEDVWLPGQEPPSSAKKRLGLFYLLIQYIRYIVGDDEVLAPSKYQGKATRISLLLLRTDCARSIPEMFMRKLCVQSVLGGQLSILADTGLRIREYCGLLFCSVCAIDGSQGRLYYIHVSGQLDLKNVRTEYPKTDPSYRVIPISKELGLMLEQEREKIEQQYGNVDVLLRLGRPDGNIYRVDSQALASNVHELTEQIPELLRQPAIVDALRKNRAYEFDLLRQNKKLESMLTCHALRRGFCTWLYGMSGVDTNDIYQIMGHANKNIPHRSGPHGATQSELYRMCLQKHVSDTFCHSAQPLKYTLGKKYRQSEVPACVIELTVPPQTEWEVTVEDTEPSTQVEFSGEGVSWSFEYQYDVKPNPTRYALLAKKEEYTIVEKQSFVTALLKDSYK